MKDGHSSSSLKYAIYPQTSEMCALLTAQSAIFPLQNFQKSSILPPNLALLKFKISPYVSTKILRKLFQSSRRITPNAMSNSTVTQVTIAGY